MTTDTRYPAAYIRRSVADDNNPGDISRAAQEQAVRDLAHRDGHNGTLRIFDDWNRSADEAKEARRAAFATMLAEIEAGHISVVYAYALDRLYRSMRTFVRLTDAAKAHGVRIVTLREGVLGGDGSPMAQAFAQITAVFSELELNTAKARARSAIRARQERGDEMGQPGWGRVTVQDPATGRISHERAPGSQAAVVIAAYKEAGSVMGAARLLTARGVPAPKGGATWHMSATDRIIRREAPNLLPPRGPQGRQVAGHAILAQLLRCHCGHIPLTPNVIRGQLYCAAGGRQGAKVHGKMAVTEAAILPWIKREAARFRVPARVGEEEAANAEVTKAIVARRSRLGIAFADGAIDQDVYRARLAALATEEAKVERTSRILDVPAVVPWGATPATVNAFLRTIWLEVRLDDDLLPIEAIWAVPSEYVGPAQRRRARYSLNGHAEGAHAPRRRGTAPDGRDRARSAH